MLLHSLLLTIHRTTTFRAGALVPKNLQVNRPTTVAALEQVADIPHTAHQAKEFLHNDILLFIHVHTLSLLSILFSTSTADAALLRAFRTFTAAVGALTPQCTVALIARPCTAMTDRTEDSATSITVRTPLRERNTHHLHLPHSFS